MNIVFDYQIFSLQRYGGISRYFNSLAKALGELNQNPLIFAPFHQNQYLKEQSPCRTIGIGFNQFSPRTKRLFYAANTLSFICATPFIRANLIHETYYSPIPVGSKTVPRIITVYDMIHELFANEFSPQDRTRTLKERAVARADHIITISHSTKRDLCRILNVPDEKVSVVHLACDNMVDYSTNQQRSNSRPYLLYVGNRGGYKNFSRLLEAIARTPRLKNEFNLIAFGGGAFNTTELEHIQHLGLSLTNIHQMTGDDTALSALYRDAAAFVYPSIYEGFGLPPLEAMSAGCPVVSSNSSSMPEVIGSAAEFFDPLSIEEMSDAIQKVIFNQARAEALRALGVERHNYFSWQKCARETLDIYHTVQ